MIKRIIIIILVLTSGAMAQDWIENNGKREWGQAHRTKVMVSHELEMIGWPGLPDSTYFKIDVGSITDSVWYSGDTTTIGISEYFHARFYNVGDNALEWEAVLYQKPGNQFSWTFPIEYQNLNFYYQPELTIEEILDGCDRPDSVVGSYAVYHSYKRNNEFQAGIAFHIYRPKAWDANSDTVWLDLSIDTVANTITISGARSWFRDAVYPVTIDPTFGFTTAGGSAQDVQVYSWGIGNANVTYTHTASAGDTVRYLVASLKSATVDGDIHMGIYTYTGSLPQNILAGSDTQINATSTSQAWDSTAVTLGLTATTVYTLCAGDWGGPNITVYYNVGPANSAIFDVNSGAGETLQDPWTNSLQSTRLKSYYANYSVAVAGGGAYRGTIIPVIGGN